MSGLLGTRAPITSDVALIIQLIVLALLLVGFRLGRKKVAGSLNRHEALMKAVVLLNTGILLLVMLPSFIVGFDLVLAEFATLGFPLILVHHSLGLVAEALGIVLVFRKFGNVRLWMRATLIVWLVALAFGFTVYVIYWALPPVS